MFIHNEWKLQLELTPTFKNDYFFLGHNFGAVNILHK